MNLSETAVLQSLSYSLSFGERTSGITDPSKDLTTSEKPGTLLGEMRVNSMTTSRVIVSRFISFVFVKGLLMYRQPRLLPQLRSILECVGCLERMPSTTVSVIARTVGPLETDKSEEKYRSVANNNTELSPDSLRIVKNLAILVCKAWNGHVQQGYSNRPTDWDDELYSFRVGSPVY